MGYILPMQYINPLATDRKVQYKRKDTKILKTFQAVLETKYEDLNKENRRDQHYTKEEIPPKMKMKRPRLETYYEIEQITGKGIHFCDVV